MNAASRIRAWNRPLRVGSMLTLGEVLPREVARVACEVLPCVAGRGDAARAELDAIIGTIRLAGFALAEADVRLMRRAHAELLSIHL